MNDYFPAILVILSYWLMCLLDSRTTSKTLEKFRKEQG